jgi:hypothetical protein
VRSKPGFQQVLKKFSLGFDDYLASKNVVVCVVDGRGFFF